jgi:hypothetical protein
MSKGKCRSRRKKEPSSTSYLRWRLRGGIRAKFNRQQTKNFWTMNSYVLVLPGKGDQKVYSYFNFEFLTFDGHNSTGFKRAMSTESRFFCKFWFLLKSCLGSVMTLWIYHLPPLNEVIFPAPRRGSARGVSIISAKFQEKCSWEHRPKKMLSSWNIAPFARDFLINLIEGGLMATSILRNRRGVCLY